MHNALFSCSVPIWSADSIQHLQHCFYCMDWGLFKNVCLDLDDLTETVPAHIYIHIFFIIILIFLILMRNCLCIEMLLLNSGTVFRPFRGVKERKSPGPDDVSGRFRKNCAQPLFRIFFVHRYKVSSASVPCIWKDSVIVLGPKITVPKSLHDFRHVALTS